MLSVSSVWCHYSESGGQKALRPRLSTAQVLDVTLHTHTHPQNECLHDRDTHTHATNVHSQPLYIDLHIMYIRTQAQHTLNSSLTEAMKGADLSHPLPVQRPRLYTV